MSKGVPEAQFLSLKSREPPLGKSVVLTTVIIASLPSLSLGCFSLLLSLISAPFLSTWVTEVLED